MKGVIIFCALLSISIGKPNIYQQAGNQDGYFRQEYKYSSSSSSFRNNELEQKKDDEGYYSRHGDLAGKVDPKVNSYSQHSEYQNPKFKQTGGADASNDFYIQQTAGQHDNTHQGYGQYGATGGTAAGFKASSGFSSSSYNNAGSVGGSLYPTDQLAILQQQLLNDLSRQLQNLLIEKRHQQSSSSYGSSQYGSSNQVNLQLLEQELRQNLTREFQEAVYRHGQQNHVTYNSQPNYQNREQLEQLHRGLEQQLLKQLEEGIISNGIQTTRSSSTSSSSNVHTGYQRPEDTIHITPGAQTTNRFGTNSGYNQGANVRIVPLSDICATVENDLTTQLNQALIENVHKYQSSSYGSNYGTSGGYNQQPNPDYQIELNTLSDELRKNLTRQLDDQIFKHYGNQQQRGGYYYTTTSNGYTPTYRVDELEQARQDILNKLLRTLQEKFRQEYSRFHQTASQYGSRYRSSGNQPQYGTTSHQNSYTYPANTGSQYNSHDTSQYTQSSGQKYNPGTYVVYSTTPIQLQDISRHVHSDISHQLQAALAEQESRYRQQQSYSNYPSTYDQQQLRQQLTEELKRNLTLELEQSLAQQFGHQEQRGSSYYTVSSGGTHSSSPNYNSQQLEQLKQQLQDNLVKDLHQGLSQQYSSYSSYSASSSFKSGSQGTGSTNLGEYNPRNTHSGIKQFHQSAFDDWDGMQADDSFSRNAHGSSYSQNQQQQTNLGKRYFGQQEQSQQQEELTQQRLQEKLATLHYGHGGQQQEDLTQQQQTEEKVGKLHLGHGQQQEDLTQQILNKGTPHSGYTQQQEDLTQKQQIEEKVGKLHYGHGQQQEDLTQQILDKGKSHSGYTQQQEDLTQQQQIEEKVGKLHLGHGQQQEDLTQQILDKGKSHSGYTQQQEDLTQQQKIEEKVGKLHLGHGQQQEDLTQQILDKGKSHSGYNQQQEDLTQQQQIEEKVGKLHLGHGHQQEDLTQQILDKGKPHSGYSQQQEDLTQQQQVNGKAGKSHFGHGQQHEDLTQQVLDKGKPNYGQQREDLTQQQQIEEKVGKLHLGHGQQQEDLTQQILDKHNAHSGYTQQQEDLTQQQQSNGKLGKSHIRHGQQQEDWTQQEDLVQQTAHENYGKPNTGPNYIQQEVTNGNYGRTGASSSTGHGSVSHYSSSSTYSQSHQTSNNHVTTGQVQDINVANDELMLLLNQHIQKQKTNNPSGNGPAAEYSQFPINEPIQQSQRTYNSNSQSSISRSSSSSRSSYSNGSSSGYVGRNEPIEEVIVTPTSSPESFWSKVGSKIENAFNKAKESTNKLIEKIKSH